ncbi:MAG: Unknown protein [uncultured Sulfurovum sp.]|uniref:T2SS protein K first SAM-like domain-containing protein n=1 Tax=uncultured Sulfurovum sp. TaxID=269237 RepID=A0A6S6T4S1_9BACT|nr:MAG: Unknown protein [uncultured Sulfurovum sp.]
MGYCMMNKTILHKKAFAFSITMWIIASLLFATVVILRFAKDEVKLSSGLNDKLTTQLMAESLLESLKFYVVTGDYTSTSLKNNLLSKSIYSLPSEIIVDGREYNLSQQMSISLQDTSGMLHVMHTPSSIVAQVLSPEEGYDLQGILKDSLDDWRDEDNVARVNGAEQNAYQALDKKNKVRNTKAIQDIHELKLIHGFDQVDFKHIESNFYYGRGTSANLMLVKNADYLAFILGVDKNFIEKMFELRESEPMKFRKNIGALPNYNDDYFSFGLSKQFKVKIKVQEGNSQSILKVMISFKKLNSRPYMTLSYTLQ